MIALHCRPPGARPSEIAIGAGLAASLRPRARDRRVFALVDEFVAREHGDLLDPAWPRLAVRGGERAKTLLEAETVLRAMVGAQLGRDALLVAIGGGTIGDLGGFCAALFLRGIACWQVPTTLMGMVDSAVGGKTAVNLPEGKNLVGCVHPPELVVVDPTFVRSLPEREFQSGLAEAIKMAIGCDATLFDRLEADAAAIGARALPALTAVVERSLAAKVAVVERDVHDDGPRRVLNLGHTLGHALEAWSDYTQTHGHCVARGLHFALDLAESRAAIAPVAAARCRRLLEQYGHQPFALPPARALESFLRRDKKTAGASVHFVLPTAVGAATVAPIPIADLLARLPT